MRHKTTWIVVWLAITVLTAAACGRLHFGADTTREVDAALRNTLGTSDRPSFVTSDAEGTRLWKLTRRFYERRQYAPAWIENAAPRPQMDDLIRAIAAADREGLDPGLYSVSVLQQQRDEASRGFLSKKGFDPKDAGTMDVWLTYLYMKYASDLADGLSDLAHADASWRIETEKFDPLDRLEQALRDGDVSRSLSDLAPTSPDYRRLREALAEYQGPRVEGRLARRASDPHAEAGPAEFARGVAGPPARRLRGLRGPRAPRRPNGGVRRRAESGRSALPAPPWPH